MVANGDSEMKLSRSGGDQFADIVKMIHEARYNAIKNVNAELVKLYWNIGEYISIKLKSSCYSVKNQNNIRKRVLYKIIRKGKLIAKENWNGR